MILFLKDYFNPCRLDVSFSLRGNLNSKNVINLPELTYLLANQGFTSKSFDYLAERFSLVQHFSAAGIAGEKQVAPVNAWCLHSVPLPSRRRVCPHFEST